MPVRWRRCLSAKSLPTLAPRFDFTFTPSTERVGRMCLLPSCAASELRLLRMRLGAANCQQGPRHWQVELAIAHPRRSTAAQTRDRWAAGWAHPAGLGSWPDRQRERAPPAKPRRGRRALAPALVAAPG